MSGSRPGPIGVTRPAVRPFARLIHRIARLRDAGRQSVDRVLDSDLLWSTLFVVVTLALLAAGGCGSRLGALRAGEFAPHDLRSPIDYDWVDDRSTDERRQLASLAVEEVWVHDVDRAARDTRQVAMLFEQGRELLAQDPSAQEARKVFADALAPETIDVLIGLQFSRSVEREILGSLRQALSERVVGSRALLMRNPTITLIEMPGGREQRVPSNQVGMSLEESRQRVRQRLRERLRLESSGESVLADLAAAFVEANVYYEPELTDSRRQLAGREVGPVVVRIAEGEVIVHRGERLTPEIFQRLQDLGRAAYRPIGPSQAMALIVLVAMLAFFLWRYTRVHQRHFRKIKHLHSLLVLMLISMLSLAEALLWISSNVVDRLDSPFGESGRYVYLIPLGAGSVLVALLANGRIATVYSAFVAILFGALNEWSGYLMLWAMLVQLAGVYAISTYRERSALLRAGLVVGGVGAASALALDVLAHGPEPLSRALYGSSLAFVGGAVGVGLLISFSLPPLESLYNVLTDLRLLELSNINNPLLTELAVKAPGSYNHSLVVGTLAEEGAKAIGANSLFCRVAAFYHDIGKMSKPEYYVENQRGTNPHDRLAPSMSALIIASHVKDGIRMARAARLPEQIIDIIPQHHGTKLMGYFFEKAKAQSDPTLGPVSEDEFRYTGPKPQTREAAIFMLADGIEAAARTIDEPTAGRLQEMIRKVSNAIVLDGQLHECDLTFSDLERIRGAFLRTLVSMYHHRVDYPGFEFGRARSEKRGEAVTRTRESSGLSPRRGVGGSSE